MTKYIECFCIALESPSIDHWEWG